MWKVQKLTSNLYFHGSKKLKSPKVYVHFPDDSLEHVEKGCTRCRNHLLYLLIVILVQGKCMHVQYIVTHLTAVIVLFTSETSIFISPDSDSPGTDQGTFPILWDFNDVREQNSQCDSIGTGRPKAGKYWTMDFDGFGLISREGSNSWLMQDIFYLPRHLLSSIWRGARGTARSVVLEHSSMRRFRKKIELSKYQIWYGILNQQSTKERRGNDGTDLMIRKLITANEKRVHLASYSHAQFS